MSFHRGWLSGRYRIFFLLPGDIKKPIINWMISCHPSILHILILILNTATFSYGLQYPTVYLLCGAISWLLGILLLSNYSVHCNPPVDIPTDVSNWYDRSHRHRSNQNLNIRKSSFFTSTTKAYYQSMIADLLYCELARLARPISFIDSPWRQTNICSHTLIVLYAISRWLIVILSYIRCHYIFHIFQYLRWCCVLYCNPSSPHLSSHTSSSHMLIVDLLFWYLHLNYKPIFHTQQLFIPIIWNDMLLM